MSMRQLLRGLDDRVFRRLGLRPDPGPFPCAWCAQEERHDMCTGTAVRPHLEGAAAFAWRRVGTAVEQCSCALAGHQPSG
jgi:hypothetical protein